MLHIHITWPYQIMIFLFTKAVSSATILELVYRKFSIGMIQMFLYLTEHFVICISIFENTLKEYSNETNQSSANKKKI